MADDHSRHTVHAVSQIMNKGLDPTHSDRSSKQMDGHGQKYVESVNDKPRHLSNQPSNHKCMEINTNSSNHTLLPALHVVYMVI